MPSILLWDPELARASRFPRRDIDVHTIHLVELGWLCGMGTLAGLMTVGLDAGLRIPGHAILRGVIPLSLGLAIVPRRHAGLVMGAGALCGVYLGRAWGVDMPGSAAITSLLLLAPVLDRVLAYVRKDGARVYFAFALAGLLSNYAGLAMRTAERFSGWDPRFSATSWQWLMLSLITYALCGIAAGLASAAIGFRWSRRDVAESTP